MWVRCADSRERDHEISGQPRAACPRLVPALDPDSIRLAAKLRRGFREVFIIERFHVILVVKGIVAQKRQSAGSPKRDTADKLAADFLGVFEPDQEHGHVPAAHPPRASVDLVRASIADNTRRAYETALRRFEQSEYPETDGGIAAYLSHLYEQGRSAACAAMLVTALRFRAKLRGFPSPVGAAATRILAGFRRLAYGRGRGKVTGVRWEQADRAAAMAEQPGNMAGLRDAAIVAVASDALLRVSEVAALDVSDVNSGRVGRQSSRANGVDPPQ